MTAQRALRELQHLRLTYGVPGRGTFVHPDAVDLLRGKLMREPVGEDDPQLRRQVADYLATQDDMFRRFHAARTTAERDQIVTDLVRHADQHRDLIDQMARYQTTHGNQGTDPHRQGRDQDDEPETTPAPRRRTPAKATKTTSTARKTTSGGRLDPAHDQTLAQNVSTRSIKAPATRARARAMTATRARPRGADKTRPRAHATTPKGARSRDDAFTSRGGPGFRASTPHRYAARQRTTPADGLSTATTIGQSRY